MYYLYISILQNWIQEPCLFVGTSVETLLGKGDGLPIVTVTSVPIAPTSTFQRFQTHFPFFDEIDPPIETITVVPFGPVATKSKDLKLPPTLLLERIVTSSRRP